MNLRTLLASALLILSSPTQAGTTIFQFVSQPGDYIGQGQALVLTTAQADFRLQGNYANGVSIHIDNFSRADPGNYLFWYVDFAPAAGGTLVPGAYEGATRFPFNGPSEPGLSISGDGRGCNQLTGRFDVREAVFDPQTGEVLQFAADFEQHCEGSDPALFGSIRYNSDIPVDLVIAPLIELASPLNDAGCVEATGPGGAVVELRGSTLGGGNPELSWSSSTGVSGAGSVFSLPLGVGAYESASLTATDGATGKSVTVTKQICVSDTTAPVVEIRNPVSGARYGDLPVLDVKVTDAVDEDISSVGVALGQTAGYALGPTGELRTTLRPRRAIGNMVEAQITVTASDASGNTGVSNAYFWIQKGKLP